LRTFVFETDTRRRADVQFHVNRGSSEKVGVVAPRLFGAYTRAGFSFRFERGEFTNSHLRRQSFAHRSIDDNNDNNNNNTRTGERSDKADCARTSPKVFGSTCIYPVSRSFSPTTPHHGSIREIVDFHLYSPSPRDHFRTTTSPVELLTRLVHRLRLMHGGALRALLYGPKTKSGSCGNIFSVVVVVGRPSRP